MRRKATISRTFGRCVCGVMVDVTIVVSSIECAAICIPCARVIRTALNIYEARKK